MVFCCQGEWDYSGDAHPPAAPKPPSNPPCLCFVRPSGGQIAGGTPKSTAPSLTLALSAPAALAALQISQSLQALRRGFGPAKRLAQGHAPALPRPPFCPRVHHFLSSLGALGGFLPRPSFPRVYSKSQCCHAHLKHSRSYRLLSIPTHQSCSFHVPSLCNPQLPLHPVFWLYWRPFIKLHVSLFPFLCAASFNTPPFRQ